MASFTSSQEFREEAKENIMTLVHGAPQKKVGANKISTVLDRTSGRNPHKVSQKNEINIGIHEVDQRNHSKNTENYSMKQKYKKELKTLSEAFPQWNENDLLAALQESEFDVQLVASRISEGLISTWNEVRKKSTPPIAKEIEERTAHRVSDQGRHGSQRDANGMKPKQARKPNPSQESKKSPVRKEVTTTSSIQADKSAQITQNKVAWSKIVQSEQNQSDSVKDSSGKTDSQTVTELPAKAPNTKNIPVETGTNISTDSEVPATKKETQENLSRRIPENSVEGIKEPEKKPQEVPVLMPPLKSTGSLELCFGSLGFGNLEDSSVTKETDSIASVHSSATPPPVPQNKPSSAPVVPPLAGPRLSGPIVSESSSKQQQTARPVDRSYFNQETLNGRNVSEIHSMNSGIPGVVPQHPGYVPSHAGPFNIPMPSVTQYSQQYDGVDINAPFRNPHVPYDPSAHHQRQADPTKVTDIHGSLGNVQSGASMAPNTQAIPGISHQQYAPNAAMQYYYPYYAVPTPGQFASYHSSFGQPFKNVYPMYSQGGNNNKAVPTGAHYGSQAPQHIVGYSVQPQYNQQQPQHEDQDTRAFGYPPNFYSQSGFQPYLHNNLGTSKAGVSNFVSNGMNSASGGESKAIVEKNYATAPSVGTPYYGGHGMTGQPNQYGIYHGQNLQSPHYQAQAPSQQATSHHPYASLPRQFWRG